MRQPIKLPPEMLQPWADTEFIPLESGFVLFRLPSYRFKANAGSLAARKRAGDDGELNDSSTEIEGTPPRTELPERQG